MDIRGGLISFFWINFIHFFIISTFLTLAATSRSKIKSFNFPNGTMAGESVSVTCMLSPNFAQTTFKWLKDGTDLDLIPRRQERIQILNANGASVLFIKNVTPTDYGNYTCIASTADSHDTFTALLIVNVPPRWILEPTDLSITEGQTDVIDCTASGIPMPTISWLISEKSENDIKEFIPINTNQIFEGITTLRNGSLLVESKKLRLKGKHAFLQCSADNKIGKSLSRTIKLSLIVPARFITNEKLTLLDAKKGESASIRCEAIGDHPLTILWFRDKKPLDFISISRYDHSQTRTVHGVISELLIRTTERNDSGFYSCEAKNAYGKAEKNIKLQILEVPSAPLEVKVNDRSTREVSISWIHSSNGNSPIRYYLFHYWTIGISEDKGKLKKLKLNSDHDTYSLRNLSPGTSYGLTVTAVNDIGYGEPSKTLIFFTFEEAPQSPPMDITLLPRGPTQILVTWRSPPRRDWNGNLTEFSIYYKTLIGNEEYSKTVEADRNETNKLYTFLLDGLKKLTLYKISIAAINSAGQGPRSQEMEARTLSRDVPPPPKIIHYQILSKNTVFVDWQPLSDLIGYTLYLKIKDLDVFSNIIPLPRHVTSHSFSGLLSNVQYIAYVSASNEYGESDMSPPVSFILHRNALSLSFIFSGNNIILLAVFVIFIIIILITIIISVVYVRRFKIQQKEESIRRLAKFSLPKDHKYVDKCGTTRSTATYATIGPAGGHVTIRSAGSNSQSSSNYGGRSDPEDVKNFQNEKFTRRLSKQSTCSIKKNFEETIYDDALGE